MRLTTWVLILGLIAVPTSSLSYVVPMKQVNDLAGQGLFAEALARFDVLHAQSDSIAAELQKTHLEELKIKHDTAGLQSSVKDLDLEQKLQKTRIQKEVGVWIYLLSGLGAVFMVGLFLFWKYLSILKRSALSLKRAKELKSSRSHLKILGGLLPVCVKCQQVRSDDGYWARVDDYLRKHSDIHVSHGICPDCVQEYYAGFLDDTQ